MHATELTPSASHPARYWRMLDDGRIQCDLCPRFCKLREGQRGLCFVRARDGDGIVLTTYGRSSGFCVDPIEKKPLNHFLPGTPVLLRHGGLQSHLQVLPELGHFQSHRIRSPAGSGLARADRASSEGYGRRSVAFTYNDPVIFLEYAVDVAQACREAGVKTVAVTAGYITQEARKEFFDAMDATNIDLKGFTEEFYKTLCTAELRAVQDTLEYVKHETSCWLEITTLLIPGKNDSPTRSTR